MPEQQVMDEQQARETLRRIRLCGPGISLTVRDPQLLSRSGNPIQADIAKCSTSRQVVEAPVAEAGNAEGGTFKAEACRQAKET